MKLLAIDTSCDDSCVAILETDTFHLLADVVHSHIKAMAAYGGVVPELASRQHLKALPLALDEALTQASLTLNQIDYIVVTHRPGLIGALLVGVSYAKSLAYALGKPLSVLNHLEAHLLSPFLARTQNQNPPPLPWIALVVSGGHTELFRVEENLTHHWLGGTLDDAAGEAFDKIGKLLGLPYPAGPVIDKWVREEATREDRTRFKIPRPQTSEFSFSFSGLKTHVRQIAQRPDFQATDTLALIASAQEAILGSLVKKLRDTKALYPHHHTVVTGGVACNCRLRELLPEAYFPAPRHCTDNAAMVAALGALHHERGTLAPAPLNCSALSR
ncbi:MAG: tRNA (adenosine(37)-N6)-threonylcarbamoyltransferase complex transferase subunit TsaD [Deltaproteobacteria bacterium]|nr:tRNA (adenosine(37)-N6)-threonylcarbamoyltransferase complex transferase subunit TsaD [Deltaproteobacteria bacterium]